MATYLALLLLHDKRSTNAMVQTPEYRRQKCSTHKAKRNVFICLLAML